MAADAPRANPLRSLLEHGQSVWLDYIRRDLMTTGELRRLIDEDGLRGMTSNPAIFEKAIAGRAEYTERLAALRDQGMSVPLELYEALAVDDVQLAADAMRAVYDASQARDGYVSLEVSPFLARDTVGTVAEARRLWAVVDRPNLMVKVPATLEGLPAIRELVGDGINVNVTLLFAVDRYEAVADAYLAGLETRAARGEPLAAVASVASFFVSRIDSLVDAKLSASAKASDAAGRAEREGLLGRVAIANAKLAYQSYRRIFSGPRWEALAARGAQTQRLLWASTSTKNPAYRDVVYVEELVGPDTVTTIPPATFDAFRDHGRLRDALTEGVDEVRGVMQGLSRAGISMDEVTADLLDDGLRLFAEPFDALLRVLEPRCQAGAAPDVNLQATALPPDVASGVERTLADWRSGGKVWRLWSGDASLWTGADEHRWLGWLTVVDEQLAARDAFPEFAAEIAQAGFTDVALLGMGGSSLAPEVLAMTFGRIGGAPRLHVLDSTDPGQVIALTRHLNLAHTLFIVSSKSGSTLEPNIFTRYFYERVATLVGRARAGLQFVAITDPGSALQQQAERDGFRRVFLGKPSIGGRYSALSAFGMMPAAAMGIDVPRLLELSDEMVRACSPCQRVEENPGVVLGVTLAAAAKAGYDKVTLVASPGLFDVGAWLEQLLAESTGKNGQALIPVDRERLAPPDRYGRDRLFVYLRLESAPVADQDTAIAALERAGFPIVNIAVKSPYTIGQEFFRWEVATAVAGAELRLNPFDQPDVEASKLATRRLTEEYEQRGRIPHETPLWSDGVVTLYADEANAEVLRAAVPGFGSLDEFLRAHIGRVGPGDYFAVLAYVEMNEGHERSLQELRHHVRDHTHAATCLGFGPRFLHSTGQAYKGGPNTGVFLQVTADDAMDLDVPGHRYTFGVVKAAQARGDFEVLAARGRRILRVHLTCTVAHGLALLNAAATSAMARA